MENAMRFELITFPRQDNIFLRDRNDEKNRLF